MSARPGFIVVGVDQSTAARAALEFALDEGLAHGCAVECVTAWLWTSPYDGMNHVTSIPEGRQVAAAVQERELQRAFNTYDQRPTSPNRRHQHAGKALVERAEGARMLVVGSARKGTVARTVAGSVSEYCVRHAPAPVVVVAAADRLQHRSVGEIEEVVT